MWKLKLLMRAIATSRLLVLMEFLCLVWPSPGLKQLVNDVAGFTTFEKRESRPDFMVRNVTDSGVCL